MTRLIGNLSEGLLFVISAPAGTGKTTLVHMLCEEFNCVKESISCTTRQPRPGEMNGLHYTFLSKEEFQLKIKQGAFLEYAEVFGHFYGTLKEAVDAERKKGSHMILVIDTQGAMQLKNKVEGTFIFISPPTLSELRERLEKRKTETEETIEKRLAWAEEELKMVTHYDYHIVNDNLIVAYDVLRSIIIAEEHKIRRT
ncbi:MAG: guanylate kinase [Rhabdochlamydiaceae bacterium]|jgi:guanylate kinase